MVQRPQVDTLAAALYGGVSLLARRLRQLGTPGGLSLPERAALARLDRGGPASAAELARAEQVTPQAMGNTLAGLEGRGLVRRRPDPDDRRRVSTSLTETGHDMLHHRRDDRSRQLAAALGDGFTAAELKTLRAAVPLIERLAENL
jgi:DNA-binding MarR family transcriptional regulator